MVFGVIAFSRSAACSLKPCSSLQSDEHRRAAGQHHDVGIAHPVGRRDDHLVAGIDGGHQRVEQHLLAAGADRDLRGLVVQPVLALELGADRLLELGNAVDRRCTWSCRRLDRLDRGVLDVVRRVEVRLARRQPDDVAALGLQRHGLVGNGDGGGRLDAVERVGDETHGRKPFEMPRLSRPTGCGGQASIRRMT